VSFICGGHNPTAEYWPNPEKWFGELYCWGVINSGDYHDGTHSDNMADMRSKNRQARQDHQGLRNPCYGVTVSAETRALIAVSEAKTVWVLDPAGQVIEIFNLTQFCRDQGLNQGGMWRVVSGHRESYKGYRALEHNYRVALAAGRKDVSDA